MTMANKLDTIFKRVATSILTIWRSSPKQNTAYVEALRQYAKTEYGNDWVFALNHMLENDGQGPRYTGTVQ